MKRKKLKMSKQDAELRLHGYLTIEEFVSAFAIGLRLYLEDNWSKDRDGVHHPEDLSSNALSFAEATFNVISIFGVNGIKVFKDDVDEE